MCLLKTSLLKRYNSSKPLNRMTTLLVSDIHLSESRPDLSALFFAFLSGPAKECEHLYILGDLFDAWAGDDLPSPVATALAEKLKSRELSGKKTYFLPGNRDFLVGKAYCLKAGMTLLADPVLVDIEGIPTLLTHGDRYCWEDKRYQRYRRFSRNPLVQWVFLHLTKNYRQNLAKRLRAASKSHVNKLPPAQMDVTPEAIIHAFKHTPAKQMIHGHIHKAGKHKHNDCTRTVLGDWHAFGSVLKCNGSTWELQNFPTQ